MVTVRVLSAALILVAAPGPFVPAAPADDPPLGSGAGPVVAPGGAIQEDIAREAAELERVRAELEKAREEAKSYSNRESEILKTLNRYDSDLTLKERLIGGLSRKEGRLAADLTRTRGHLESEREKLAERREILRRRLRNIYKVGERPGLQVLLGATSAIDLIRRFDWLLLVAAQDRRLYDNVQESIRTVRDVETELAGKVDEVQAIRRESEQEKAELIRQKDARSSLLASVRTEKRRQDLLIAELEQAEQEVQSLLTRLEERAATLGRVPELPPEGTAFAAAKGRLPWPVQGRVTRWFGVQRDRRFGTSTFNGGIDIRAERDADVIAVHTGRADYVDWLPGYGQCIILNHGAGYYTLYAHTSRVFVSPGELVAAGDVIASVGDTGSLLGDVLHFEIRKDAEPLNPAPWLQAARLR